MGTKPLPFRPSAFLAALAAGAAMGLACWWLEDLAAGVVACWVVGLACWEDDRR
jgi:hypothetical protein